jgi:hypothetical protein
VQPREHRLQQHGLIQPRPRGGGYPRERALARQDGGRVSAGTREVSRQVSPDAPPVQYLPPSQDERRPLLTDILQELPQLGVPGAATGKCTVRALAQDTLIDCHGTRHLWSSKKWT